MTAVTDTRKRSRDEDNCDFMPISKRINNLSITNQHHIFSSHDSNELPASGLYSGNEFGMQHQQPSSEQTAYYSEQMQNANHFQANGHHQQYEHHHHHQQQQQQQQQQPQSQQQTQQQQQQQHHHQHHQSSHISNNGAPHRYIAMHSHENNDSHLGGATSSINGRLHHTIVQHPHSHHQHQNSQQQHNLNAIDIENYSPELTAAENPFYYNKNKLLFDLHLERERRNQQANH